MFELPLLGLPTVEVPNRVHNENSIPNRHVAQTNLNPNRFGTQTNPNIIINLESLPSIPTATTTAARSASSLSLAAKILIGSFIAVVAIAALIGLTVFFGLQARKLATLTLTTTNATATSAAINVITSRTTTDIQFKIRKLTISEITTTTDTTSTSETTSTTDTTTTSETTTTTDTTSTSETTTTTDTTTTSDSTSTTSTTTTSKTTSTTDTTTTTTISETTSTTSTTTTSETTSTTSTTTTSETTSTTDTTTTSDTTSTKTTTTTSETKPTTSTTTTSETTSTTDTTTTTSETTSTTSTTTTSETTSTTSTTTTSETTSTTDTTTTSETTSTTDTTTSEATPSTLESSTLTSKTWTTRSTRTRAAKTATVCSDPCQNGGTCASPGVCVCKLGYTGKRCETSSGGCYYGEDRVDLVNGGQRYIKELKVGDQIWSIKKKKSEIIKDEIVLMMHNDRNKSVIFYTFKSSNGNEISLTASHILPIFNSNSKQIQMVRASQVTIKDHLIMSNQYIKLVNISINIRQGFYNPLTLSGYLLVNNISTSVFSDNYKVSCDTVQLVFTPIRIYYRLTRWIFGNNYNPFGDVDEGVHPIAQFYKEHQSKLRFLVKLPDYFLLTIFVLILIDLIQKEIVRNFLNELFSKMK